jgi:NitT/TauT family transport system substrate-binding protein
MEQAMKPIAKISCAVALGLLAVATAAETRAEDRLKVAVPQRGAWETSVPELGQQAGIFKKHGLALELSYMATGKETEAAVVSGAADVALGVEAMAALQAYSRGTPVRIIGANLTGDPTYWYVPADSPIKRVSDLDDTTIGFASNGSASQYDAFDLLKYNKIKARLVASGGMAATLERVRDDRLDVGWAVPPFGLEEIVQGKLRVVARANDIRWVRGKTDTVILAAADTLSKRRDLVSRFTKAYRETVEWMYAEADALKHYAAFAAVSPDAARTLRDEFYPKSMLVPDQVVGLRGIIRDAIKQRFIQFKPSRKQLAELIRTPTPVSASILGSIFGR